MSVNEMHGVIENPLNDETLQQLINLMEMNLNRSLYEILKRTKNNLSFEYKNTNNINIDKMKLASQIL